MKVSVASGLSGFGEMDAARVVALVLTVIAVVAEPERAFDAVNVT
jgi:hypothetical protein